MKVNKWIYGGLSVLLLTGCVMGPRYHPPVANIPQKYNISGYHSKETHHQNPKEWWEVFDDDTLNILINNVRQSNLDVKTALAREEEARAQYKVYTAQYFPTISAQALPPTGTGNSLTQVLGLFFTWVPDLFGKVQSNQAMSKATLEAAAADHDNAVLNLSAEIANAYWELRGHQEIHQTLLKNIHADQTIYQTLQRNYRTGKDNYMKVLQQDALVETEQAELSQSTAEINALISKIEILSGENPGALTPLLSTSSNIRLLDININLGMPSQLLTRRPDITAAERRVAATHANINAAIADLFPTVSLGWLLSWQSHTLAANVFSLNNSDHQYFAMFNAPLLNYSLYKIVDVKKRQEATAVIQYELTVLRALHDVTVTYNYYQEHKKSALHYGHAMADQKLTVKLLDNLYRNHELDFDTVLQGEKELHKLEAENIRSKVAYYVALVNLYKALGGNVY